MRRRFEILTVQGQRVVILAQKEARMLNHNYIGTEHLLLSLIHENEGVAAKALESMGISLEAARQQVKEIIGHGRHPPSGQILFTAPAKKVLRLALRESKYLNDDFIDTEHILLGMIREHDGVGAQVLVMIGADLDRVRNQIVRLRLGQPHRRPRGFPARQAYTCLAHIAIMHWVRKGQAQVQSD